MSEKSPSSGELAHYGVKGMKWGVRREKIKKAAITVGAIAGTTAVVIGAAYALKNANNTPISAIHPNEAAENFVKSVLKEPIDVVHVSRGVNKSNRFLKNGGLSEPVHEYDRAGFAGDSIPVGTHTRYGERSEKIAVRFPDPKGRVDFAGRPIDHEVMVPESIARHLGDSYDDIVQDVWPRVRDEYDAFYESSKTNR